MLFENNTESGGRSDLHWRPMDPRSLPPEIVAQEGDIEAMFQDLIADSRDLREVRDEQARVGWIFMALLSLFSVLGFWLLYLKAEGH